MERHPDERFKITPVRRSGGPHGGHAMGGNIVATSSGYGLIDFGKLMFAPPVFDLTKLIGTGVFSVGEQAP
jgi:hypothetical protein